MPYGSRLAFEKRNTAHKYQVPYVCSQAQTVGPIAVINLENEVATKRAIIM